MRKGAKKGRRGVKGGVAGINFRHEVGRRGGHGETREEASGKGGARVGKVEGRERGVAGGGEGGEWGGRAHSEAGRAIETERRIWGAKKGRARGRGTG